MEIKKIKDIRTGEIREIGGQEYTAGEGIKIENGVISALGGGSKLYKHGIYFKLKNAEIDSHTAYMEIFNSSNEPFTAQTLYNYFYGFFQNLEMGDEKKFLNVVSGEHSSFSFVTGVLVCNYDSFVLGIHGYRWDYVNTQLEAFHEELYSGTEVDNIIIIKDEIEEVL